MGSLRGLFLGLYVCSAWACASGERHEAAGQGGALDEAAGQGGALDEAAGQGGALDEAAGQGGAVEDQQENVRTEFRCTFGAPCSEGAEHCISTATQTASLPVHEDTVLVWYMENFVSDETEVRVTLKADGGLEYGASEYAEVPNELSDSWTFEDGLIFSEYNRHIVHASLSCQKVTLDD